MMPPDEIANIVALAKACREAGVRVLDLPGNVRLELEPLMPDPKPAVPVVKHDDECKCGHMAYEHGPNGDCLRGCDPLKCSPESET